jgi:CPA1 family monovalent cation:H+ antiporter
MRWTRQDPGRRVAVSLPAWLLLSSGLLAAAVALGLVARRVGLQLTVVLVVVGFAARLVGDAVDLEIPLEGEGFEEVVVFLFLPVLVFEAALGLSVRAFFRNLGPILVLAVVALLASAALVGGALALVLGTPLTAALLFGALISATDPVAVVAVFRQLGVPERLLVLVEGESLLNDGVAIVLFTILLSAALGGEAGVGSGIIEFLQVFFGGAAIGAVLGLAAAVLLAWLDRNLAAALTVAVAYGSFVLADDVLGFSGVMAGVAAGIVIAGFAPSRASAEVREMLESVWEALGYIANALLFLLIGLAIEPGSSRSTSGPSRWPSSWCSSRGPPRSCPSCRCSSASRGSRRWGGATRRCSSGAGCAAGWRSRWRSRFRSASPSGTCSSP